MNTGQQVNFLGANAHFETMIKSDSKKNIYYVNANGDFYQIPFNGTNYSPAVALSYKQAPSTAWNVANGHFDINKKSDVIYFIGVNDRIYQLHLQPSGLWKSQQPADDRDFVKKSHIIYRYPHAYYIAGNYIHNLFYFAEEGCNVLQRQGENNFNWDESISFVTYPNPTYDRVTIRLEEKIQSGKVELISGIGEVIFSNPITGNSLEWNLESLSSGIYLVVLKDVDGNFVQSEKLMVVE